MTSRIRTNTSTAFQTTWSAEYWRSTTRMFSYSGNYSLYNVSTIADSLHPGWDKSQSCDVGGAMLLNSNIWQVTPANLTGQIGNLGDPVYRKYVGSVVPIQSSPITWSPAIVPSTSDANLIVFGTKAIASTSPTKSAVLFGTDLGETVQSGMPSMVGLETMKSRTLPMLGRAFGKEYLNVVFGWLPLLSDVQKLAKAVKSSHKIISQYERGSDSKIRRRYTPPYNQVNGVKTGTTIYLYPNGGLTTQDRGVGGAVSMMSLNRDWFSGAFKYHVPMGDDIQSRMRRYYQEAKKLTGIALTPQLVWELAPWSWAYDWFSDVGAIMANVSSLGSDGLVLQYGYAMSENVFRITYATSARHLSGALIPCAATNTVKRARRLVSTPYGFGFDMSSLTAKQDAVVVALGISKSHR